MKKTSRIFALFAAVVLLFSSLSVPAFAAAAPSAPKKLTASADSVSVVLRWSKASAAGYGVYRLENSKYKKLATTKQNTYTVKNLKPATSYVFAVRAYSKQGKKIVWSKKYVTVKAKTKAPAAVTLKASAGNGKAVLSWSASKGAQGYAVFRYASKEWKKIATVKADVRKYTVTKLKNGSTYKFAVKPYVKVGGKTVWGARSKTVCVKPLKVSSASSVQAVCDKYNKAVNDLKAYQKLVRITLADSSTVKVTDCSNESMVSMMNSLMSSMLESETYVSYFVGGKNIDGEKLSDIVWPNRSDKVELKAEGVKKASLTEKDGGHVIRITLKSEKIYHSEKTGKTVLPKYNNIAVGEFNVEDIGSISLSYVNIALPETELTAVTDSDGRLVEATLNAPFSGKFVMNMGFAGEESNITVGLGGADSRTLSAKYS